MIANRALEILHVDHETATGRCLPNLGSQSEAAPKIRRQVGDDRPSTDAKIPDTRGSRRRVYLELECDRGRTNRGLG